MTVKDVFELRKQGRIEEAYEAIRPMYAVHKGKYTTLAMFWTGSDIMRKRLTEKRHTEARKIFEALLHVLPNIDDKDGKAHASVMGAAVLLGETVQGFNTLAFISDYATSHLRETDWQAFIPEKKEGETDNKRQFPLPSNAQRLLTQAFHQLRRQPTVDNALVIMPMLQEALRRRPYDKNHQRQMAVVYGIMGEREKAANLYKQMLTRYHDSWLYADLAQLTDDPGHKAALLCQAITHQRQKQFRSGYHLQLAQLLADRDPSRAAHELQQCIAIRKAEGHPITKPISELSAKLSSVTPTTLAAQSDFYRRMAEKYGIGSAF